MSNREADAQMQDILSDSSSPRKFKLCPQNKLPPRRLTSQRTGASHWQPAKTRHLPALPHTRELPSPPAAPFAAPCTAQAPGRQPKHIILPVFFRTPTASLPKTSPRLTKPGPAPITAPRRRASPASVFFLSPFLHSPASPGAFPPGQIRRICPSVQPHPAAATRAQDEGHIQGVSRHGMETRCVRWCSGRFG